MAEVEDPVALYMMLRQMHAPGYRCYLVLGRAHGDVASWVQIGDSYLVDPRRTPPGPLRLANAKDYRPWSRYVLVPVRDGQEEAKSWTRH